MNTNEEITSECICGLSVMETMNQRLVVSNSRYNEKYLEKGLTTLEEKIKNMGAACKIEVGDPLKWIGLFRGFMDNIGYRERPEEGLNYYEIDLDNYIIAIGDSIQNALKNCEKSKGSIKQIARRNR
jgi:hypothetical protein